MSAGGWLCASAVAATAIGSASCRANDSSAELAVGGLVLVKNDTIELKSEDLFISPREVRVRYRFFNATPQPVTTLVAFPLPDIALEDSNDVVAVPKEDALANFVGFATRVGGRPVTARVEQKALANGVDRTSELVSLGVPLAPYLQGEGERLDQLPQAARKTLVAEGLAHEEVEYEGDKRVTRLFPTWTLKTSYYWDQTFAPGETIVEHSYSPSVGISLGSTIGSATIPDLLQKRDPDELDRLEIDEFNEHVKSYCIDRDFIASARRIEKALPQTGVLAEQRIAYVLKTAANWRGPIGDFRLVVDKESPDNLVSFCGEGVRKTGPTTFEMTRKDFTPTDDIAVLILTTHPPD